VRRRVGGRFVTHEEAGARVAARQPTRRIVARARSQGSGTYEGDATGTCQGERASRPRQACGLIAPRIPRRFLGLGNNGGTFRRSPGCNQKTSSSVRVVTKKRWSGPSQRSGRERRAGLRVDMPAHRADRFPIDFRVWAKRVAPCLAASRRYARRQESCGRSACVVALRPQPGPGYDVSAAIGPDRYDVNLGSGYDVFRPSTVTRRHSQAWVLVVKRRRPAVNADPAG
jgi:hypothetical protein